MLFFTVLFLVLGTCLFYVVARCILVLMRIFGYLSVPIDIGAVPTVDHLPCYERSVLDSPDQSGSSSASSRDMNGSVVNEDLENAW